MGRDVSQGALFFLPPFLEDPPLGWSLAFSRLDWRLVAKSGTPRAPRPTHSIRVRLRPARGTCALLALPPRELCLCMPGAIRPPPVRIAQKHPAGQGGSLGYSVLGWTRATAAVLPARRQVTYLISCARRFLRLPASRPGLRLVPRFCVGKSWASGDLRATCWFPFVSYNVLLFFFLAVSMETAKKKSETLLS